MIPVEEGQERILAAFSAVASELVPLPQAFGRVLAEDVRSRVTQPWAAVSAMDGYAARAADVATAPATLVVVGHVPAGQSYDRPLARGEAVRIFTGAPLPAGADTIVIQENTRAEGERVVVLEPAAAGRHVRAAGLDFAAGQVMLRAGRVLTARDVGLAAAMNVPWLPVRRRPRIAILATGDEVVMPGDPIGPNQIASANALALAALVEALGGVAINLGIAADDRSALATMAAGAAGADLLVTTGGASVGDHDLVREVLGAHGLALDFWTLAMRPGKPLMFGRLGATPLLGLPGNPVSSLVCGIVFARPIIEVLLGLPPTLGPTEEARLGRDLAANDRRQDYLRASLERDGDGALVATPAAVQDSSMLSVLAAAGCLVVRPPQAPAARAGERVPILRFPSGLQAV